MTVKINIIDDVLTIVSMQGEVSVFDEDFELLSKELVAYIKMGIFRYIVDLSKVTYIDSSGVGLLIRLATTAMKKETQSCVICDQPSVLRVLTVSNVDRIMKFVKSVDEGIEFYKEHTGLVLKNS